MKPEKWVMQNADQQNEGDRSYVLRLFITGASPNSTRAVDNIKAFCEKYLKDKYQLEIIAVYQQPDIAEQEQIIALPLLIKKSPGNERRLIGDMSDTQKILQCFNLTP